MPILADPDESASPWRWVRRLLPLVAMGVGVGLQPGSLVIFSGAAALDPHSAITFFGAIVRACHDGVACFQWYEEEIGCHHMSRGDFVAIHPSLQKVRILSCHAFTLQCLMCSPTLWAEHILIRR